MALFLCKSMTCSFSRNSSSVRKSPNLTFSFLYSTASEEHPLKAHEFLMQNHHFSPEVASQVGSRLKTLENADSVLSFLRQNGFSTAQLEKTVKSVPIILSANLEKIKPKIRVFQDLGHSAVEIADIVSGHPKALIYSVNRIVSILSVLKGLLGSDVAAVKCFSSSGMIFGNLEKTLLPNVEFLKSCGVPDERITWIIRKHPSMLVLYKPEFVRKFVERIDGMGLGGGSTMFVHALKVVSSMSSETWERKLKTFQDLGFSEDDILRVFRNSPMVFAKSEEKIKKVTEVLLETGKYDMLCIINSPTVFCYSIEKRYRPRLQVLTILEKKNLIKKWPSLGTLHLLTDAAFFEKFVAPYLDEVGHVWSAVSAK